MAALTRYALLKPATLETVGKAVSGPQQGQLDMRAVTEGEALSGIGTYVGSAVSVARVWDYGIAVGYNWKSADRKGTLQVTFNNETLELEYREGEIQDLALETYALRPCWLRSVMETMPGEMRALHDTVQDHFNGIGQAARRSSATVLKKASGCA
ncbi:hypothetical protein PHYSODRAFT_319237 [Phytophthora sojae]|uniref:Uncharacterized protein n=1 Tax=Phytophthora sojae (strain P6497) TaxID=1094619 RepID=G5A9N7_PHYSP|nr:hypothetical protein PHYSODRAFT_319237 [Phytophthora sojae]EGZ07317.1 hypothetical protein PHYSODRAFT_319237 [Phytophthora sojae]|eukprot:XP_009536883.1 hypothetical protein PHYSODRAFT_319237 [Phytophthora sojae]